MALRACQETRFSGRCFRSAPARARRLRLVAGWVAVCALLGMSAAPAAAQEIESRYQLAVTQFYQVQHDATGAPEARAARWQSVAATFQRIHRDSPTHVRGADALYSAALALRQAWLADKTAEHAATALGMFQEFSTAYPNHALGDDSRMHQAALLESRSDGAAAAMDLYRQVARRKPAGPQAPLARARLNALLRQERSSLPAESAAKSPAATDPGGESGPRSTGTRASAAQPAVAKGSTPVPAKGSARLKRMQVLSALQFTRIILTTDRLVKPKVEQNPAASGQLRLDFKRLAPERSLTIPRFAEDGVLRGIAVTPLDRQSTRLAFDVVDLERYELKTFELPMETKLVVDLYPRRAAPAAQAGDKPVARAERPRARPAGAARAVPAKESAATAVQGRAIAAPSPGEADRASLKASLGLKIKTVMIDPGHGGHDPGATAFGLQEKDIALAIAQRLRDLIRTRHPEVRVGMTREEDRFIPLSSRPKLAKAFGADLFVSIHLNASQVERFHGVETYFLNLTSDSSALEVAARENATSEKKVSDLNVILLDLLRDTNILESSKLAQALHTELVDTLKEAHPVRDLGVKQAPFMVLIGAEMPSVLVEAGFVTNRAESERLKDADYLSRIAGGIYAGLDRYISGEEIVQVRPRSPLASHIAP